MRKVQHSSFRMQPLPQNQMRHPLLCLTPEQGKSHCMLHGRKGSMPRESASQGYGLEHVSRVWVVSMGQDCTLSQEYLVFRNPVQMWKH